MSRWVTTRYGTSVGTGGTLGETETPMVPSEFVIAAPNVTLWTDPRDSTRGGSYARPMLSSLPAKGVNPPNSFRTSYQYYVNLLIPANFGRHYLSSQGPTTG